MRKNLLLTLALFLGSYDNGNAQLTTSYEIHDFLIQYGLLGEEHFVENVYYMGESIAFGQFQLNDPTIPMSHGLILTTGTIKGPGGPIGPNNMPNAGVKHETYAPFPWTANGQQAYDRAELVIQFTAGSDSLELTYFFASEEYPEYVLTDYNDVMRIWISGTGIVPDGTYAAYRNIARLPDGSMVNVSNVHGAGVNTNGYSFQENNGAYYVNNPSGSPILQYDGYTKPLLAKTDLVPGETYTLIIGIADLGDATYDSGVFIEQCATCNLNTGLAEQGHFRIYPNPVLNQLTVEQDRAEKLDIRILDIHGRMVRAITINQGRQAVDLEDLLPGMYFVVPSENESYFRRIPFMKQ